jgi:hypothetical protein
MPKASPGAKQPAEVASAAIATFSAQDEIGGAAQAKTNMVQPPTQIFTKFSGSFPILFGPLDDPNFELDTSRLMVRLRYQ